MSLLNSPFRFENRMIQGNLGKRIDMKRSSQLRTWNIGWAVKFGQNRGNSTLAWGLGNSRPEQ